MVADSLVETELQSMLDGLKVVAPSLIHVNLAQYLGHMHVLIVCCVVNEVEGFTYTCRYSRRVDVGRDAACSGRTLVLGYA